MPPKTIRIRLAPGLTGLPVPELERGPGCPPVLEPGAVVEVLDRSWAQRLVAKRDASIVPAPTPAKATDPKESR